MLDPIATQRKRRRMLAADTWPVSRSTSFRRTVIQLPEKMGAVQVWTIDDFRHCNGMTNNYGAIITNFLPTVSQCDLILPVWFYRRQYNVTFINHSGRQGGMHSKFVSYIREGSC